MHEGVVLSEALWSQTIPKLHEDFSRVQDEAQ